MCECVCGKEGEGERDTRICRNVGRAGVTEKRENREEITVDGCPLGSHSPEPLK